MTLNIDKKEYYLFSSLSLVFIFLFLYQNCGDVNIKDSQSTVTKTGSFLGKFCSSYSSDRKGIVQTFIVRNLNASFNFMTNAQEGDSDMDGLSDSVEKSEVAQKKGFNFKKRRSVGSVLDSFCWNLPENQVCPKDLDYLNDSILQSSLRPGFLPSDLIQYHISNSSALGIDVDGDGIPDFVEFLLGLDPIRFDDLHTDFDGDKIDLFSEIEMGRSPKYNEGEALGGRGYQSYSYWPEKSVSCSEGQTGYSFRIDSITLVPVEGLETGDLVEAESYLAHGVNENLIGLFVVSRFSERENNIQNDESTTSILQFAVIKWSSTEGPQLVKDFQEYKP